MNHELRICFGRHLTGARARYVILFAISSLVLISAQTAWSQTFKREVSVDYPGNDYTSFIPKVASPDTCEKECAVQAKCQAYTFVKPGERAPKGRCYLKSASAKRVANACCVSGVRAAAASAPQTPGSAPITPPVTGPGVGPGSRAGSFLPNRFSDRRWLFANRRVTADQRHQSVPLTPAEAPRIGPVQENCPSQSERRSRDREDFCRCLTAKSSEQPRSALLDLVEACAADERARQAQIPENISVDVDRDGAQSVCFGGIDCDDSDPNRYPGNTEVFDAEHRDEDCDPTTVGGRSADIDGDGFLTWDACNFDGRQLTCGTDCDDRDPTVRPVSTEVCDGKDNDCDGDIDEGVSRIFYRDADGDGFGDPQGATMPRCGHGPGWEDRATDCDDTNAAVNPSAGNCPRQ